jgi:hypothetical protein
MLGEHGIAIAHGDAHCLGTKQFVVPNELIDEEGAADLRLNADIAALRIQREYLEQSLPGIDADIDDGARLGR